MGFKFKPEGILDFYCPGFDLQPDTALSVKVDKFKQYLELVDIQVDARGFLDLDQLKTTYMLNNDLIKTQYNSLYTQQVNTTTTNLYDCLLKNSFNIGSEYRGSVCLGYITIPFYIHGSNTALKIVLPGTTPYFTPRMEFNSSSIRSGASEFTLKRTPTELIFKASDNSVNKKLVKTDFEDGVIPLLITVGCQAGGGEGSSSGTNQYGKAAVISNAGAGGGSGAMHWGIINFIPRCSQDNTKSSIIYIQTTFQTSYTSDQAWGDELENIGKTGSGANGYNISILNDNKTQTICTVSGGKGAIYAKTPGSGGTVDVSQWDYPLYRFENNVFQNFAGENGGTGGTGRDASVLDGRGETYAQNGESFTGNFTLSTIKIPSLFATKNIVYNITQKNGGTYVYSDGSMDTFGGGAASCLSPGRGAKTDNLNKGEGGEGGYYSVGWWADGASGASPYLFIGY